MIFEFVSLLKIHHKTFTLLEVKEHEPFNSISSKMTFWCQMTSNKFFISSWSDKLEDELWTISSYRATSAQTYSWDVCCESISTGSRSGTSFR